MKTIKTLSVKWIAALMVILVVSCSKTADMPVVDPSVNNTTTAIVNGNVFSVDNFGNLLNDNSNISVTLSNGTETKLVTTDASGSFKIADVKTGTYNVSFSKEGFETYYTTVDAKAGVLNMVKSAFIGPKAMHKILATNPLVDNNGLQLNIDSPDAYGKNKGLGFTVFFSKNANVSNTQFSNNITINTETGGMIQIASKAKLEAMGFVKGQTIYMAVYPNTFNASAYEQNGITVFPTLNTNNIQLLQVGL